MAEEVLKGYRPCPRRWEDLGQGPRRFCTDCNKVVHDLDALGAGEVEELVRANPDGFCATFVSDASALFRANAFPGATGRTAAAAAMVAAAVLIGCSDPAGSSDQSAPRHETATTS